ncbi:hypothetical protein JCM8547_007899 [Rhodosporidiobolus lusitaniae]
MASLAVPSVCGSFTSSRFHSSSTASSLFSKASYATDVSTPEPAPPVHQQAPPPPPLDPSTKAASIRLPLHLPTPPEEFAEVDVADLLVDEELEGAPVGFAVGKLRSVGSALLNVTTATTLHLPPSAELPQYLRSTLPSLPLPHASPLYLPSHVLAIRSNDSSRTLLLPVHGLPWASSSPALSILSSRPEKQPPHPSLPSTSRPYPSPEHGEGATYLPVVELNLPSSAAFPCLQGWIYLRSPALLLSALLPTPPSSSSPPSPPSSLSHLLNPAPSTSSPYLKPLSPETLTQNLAAVSSQTLLQAVHLVHGLWGNVVALQIGDEDLWRVMGLAWKILVAALALRERGRRATSSGSDSE